MGSLAPGFAYAGGAKHRLSYGQVKMLAQAFGLPGDAIAQIAKGESGGYADVQQRDPGDGMIGYGLLQMTPNAWGKGSTAYRKMQSLGGVAAMRDPVKNMEMARFLYQQAGNKLTPWYGTRYLTNRSGEGKLGAVNRALIPGSLHAEGGLRASASSSGSSNGAVQALQTLATGSAPSFADLTLPQRQQVQITAPSLPDFAAKGVGTPTSSAPSPARRFDVNDALGTLARTSGQLAYEPTGATASTGATGAPKAPKAPTAKAPGGVGKFEGKAVAGWIAPILQYARQQGWKGTVNSGFRTLADQTRIYNSGVRPAAKPGTSNHEFTGFPGGAVDVSDAASLSRILQRSPYGKKLVWAGAKDPVHFSHPHGGSY